MKPYKNFFKRTFDIVVSGGALVVLFVPLAAVTVWLYIARCRSLLSARASGQGWQDIQDLQVQVNDR